MFDKKRYIRNITFNWGALAASVAVGFVLSPFIVKSLGDAGYGYWSLVVTVTSYFAYFDLGIQSGVSHYITRHLADGNQDKLVDKANSALTALFVIGVAVFAAFVGASVFFDSFFHVRPEAAAAVRTALLMMGFVTAAKFPLSVFQAMLIGAQRFDLMSGTSLLVKVVNAVLVFLALRMRHGLLGLALVAASTQILEGLVWLLLALHVVPWIRFRMLAFHRPAFAELFRYGAFNFLINIFYQFGASFGTFIIGREVVAEAVTYYSIGSEMLPYMGGLITAVNTPLLQIVIPMDVRSDLGAIRDLLLTGTRYLFGLVCLIALNLLLVGHAFLAQWMGAKYLDPHPYGSSGTILSLLTIANAAALSSAVAQQILCGQRKNRLLAGYILAESAGMIGLALVLVPRFGILGMAEATLIPMVLVEGLLVPAITARQVDAGIAAYWKKGILPNLAVAAAVYAVSRPLLPLMPHWGWSTVFLSFTFVSVLHLAAAGFFLVEREHKSQVRRLLARGLAFGMRAG